LKTTFRFYQLSLPRKRFEISTGIKTTAEVFIVEAEAGDIRGLGSGTPALSVNDNPSKCRNALQEECEQAIDLQDYFDDRTAYCIRDKSRAAAAAIDIAVWDLFAKGYGVSLCAILGISGHEILTGATVDIRPPPEAAECARRLAEEGFKRIKIKVGTSVSSDVDRVRAVREAVGNEIELFVDANGGFDVEKAAIFWERTRRYALTVFEQPVPPDRLSDMAWLRKEYGIPICADESVSDEKSLESAIQEEALDILNLKLMKCGGLTPAIEMIKLARDAGLEVMTGCMGDIGISIAAAAHLSIAKDVKYTELDSHLNIEKICDGPNIEDGILRIDPSPGLGVKLIEGWQRWAVR